MVTEGKTRAIGLADGVFSHPEIFPIVIGKVLANGAGTAPAVFATTNHHQTKNTKDQPMTKHSKAKFCALAAGILSVPAISFAGTETAGKEAKPVVEQVKESCITGDIGINVVSQYVSRGVIFENQGAILQPYADLYFKLYEGEGFLNAVSLNLGISVQKK